MLQSFVNIFRLTVKELRALMRDTVMIVLMGWIFTGTIFVVAQAMSTDVRDVSIGVIDEDRSPLSRRLIGAIQPPMFETPVLLTPEEAAVAQVAGNYVLALTIPPDFERDLRRGETSKLMILVDATAVAQAGNASVFLQRLIASEISDWASPGSGRAELVDVVIRSRFNPNMTAKWFSAVMQLMNGVTILTLILAGAAMIREREQGTIEHVLVMPVRPFEIVFSKLFATAGTVLVCSLLSLSIVIETMMGIPITGSIWLYVLGAAIYTIAIASIGLLLASFTHTMGQFGLLMIPAIIILHLLSGSMTPMESMPDWMQLLMKITNPAPHFVNFTQAVLYRNAGIDLVADKLAAMTAMSVVALTVVLIRFRKVLAN